MKKRRAQKEETEDTSATGGFLFLLFIMAVATWVIYIFEIWPFASYHQKNRAFDFVTTAVQDTQKIFKDQYMLSMPLDNERGSVVVVEITDKKLSGSSNNSNSYIIYALTKQQSDLKRYEYTYSKIFVKGRPSDEEVNGFARENGLM